ncbi:DUF3422 domain-containing protein [Sphingobium sp. CR28]|uniref:DUF3422 domain-containing protein n=1 Tax=Sphingobium sp. CR28 TaxID=3400272 RepID=UPI003FEEC471
MTGEMMEHAQFDHPLRDTLTAEMHQRKFLTARASSQLYQSLVIADEKDAWRSLQTLVSAWPDAPPVREGARYYRCPVGEGEFVWEAHTEFVTYTLIQPLSAGDRLPPEGLPVVDLPWKDSLPGAIMRSTHMLFLGAEWEEPERSQHLQSQFSFPDLILCDVAGSSARVYSDFRRHGDAGRIIVVDHGLCGNEAAHVLQQLLELGNYRKMALLGLPVARSAIARLRALELRLANVTRDIARESSATADLLAEVSGISEELAAIHVETSYRLGASKAYGTLVEDRLRGLEVTRVRGFLALDQFTERRLAPALRTCESLAARLSDLSARAHSTSALLRTRLDLALAEQNNALLRSLDQRGQAQLRLQQTVEGLSVAAISYYVLALVGYMLEALHLVSLPASSEIIHALLVPVIVFLVWSIARRHRRAALEEGADVSGH